MERLKKLSLKKQRKSSTSSSHSKGPGTGGVTTGRARRHALIQPFGHNKTEKQLIKQYQAAVEAGNSTRVRELLEGGLELADIDDDSESLRFACRNGHTETVAVLLRYGAQINQAGDAGAAPLHIAARQGDAGLVALLLSQGANVNLPTLFEQKSPLHISALHGRDAIAGLLLENNATVDSLNIYGTTPLQLAARMGNTATLDTLFQYKPDANAYDNDGWTALHLAADCGNLQVAGLMLRNNVQVDCQNKYGRTPLHWACSRGHLSMVKLLLKHKAAVGIKDRHGKTAFDYSNDRNITTLLKLNLHKEEVDDPQPTAIGIGRLIDIDPRESMVRKVYGEAGSAEAGRLKNSGGLWGVAIPEEDEEDGSVSDANSNVIWMKSGSQLQIGETDYLADSDMTEKGSLCHSLLSHSTDPSSQNGGPEHKFSSTPVLPAHGDYDLRAAGRTSSNPSNVTSVSTVSEGEAASVKSSGSDNNNSSSAAELREYKESRDMFKSLMKALTSHNERLTKDIRFMYNDISKSLLASDAERRLGSLKSARARLEVMENTMFDFQEETEAQSEKIKGAMNEFLGKAKSKFSNTNSLGPKFYVSMFHAIGTYLCTREGEWKKVSRGLAKGSVEVLYDMEKEIESAGDSESDKVYKCMDYLLWRTTSKDTLFIKDLLDFVVLTCDLGTEAKFHILYEYINHITSHKPVNINTTQMKALSEGLQEKGRDLAVQLQLPIGKKTDAKEWQAAPNYKNMSMFSEWRTHTASKSVIDRLSKLIDALINIEKENLLSVVLPSN